jgi:hypothetical protein
VGVLDGMRVGTLVAVEVFVGMEVDVLVDVGIFVAVNVLVGTVGTLVGVFDFLGFFVGLGKVCPFPVGGAPAKTFIGMILTITNEIPTTARNDNDIFRMFIPTLLCNWINISM